MNTLARLKFLAAAALVVPVLATPVDTLAVPDPKVQGSEPQAAGDPPVGSPPSTELPVPKSEVPSDGLSGTDDPDVAAPKTPEPSQESICETVESAATENAIPVVFFTRLIWQESRFNPEAVSSAGAQGIAQFMPRTAAHRGLDDPFDPIEALHHSAQYLRELFAQFGNLGLAAAAYNGGPGRVQNWLDKRGGLPRETQNYVRQITGRSAEEWSAAKRFELITVKLPDRVPCRNIPVLPVALPVDVPPLPPNPPEVTAQSKPAEAKAKVAEAKSKAADEKPRSKSAAPAWVVQLVTHYSETKARARYAQLQKAHTTILGDHEPLVVRAPVPGRGSAAMHRLRIGAATREAAEKLCSRLKAAGAKCVVLKNEETDEKTAQR